MSVFTQDQEYPCTSTPQNSPQNSPLTPISLAIPSLQLAHTPLYLPTPPNSPRTTFTPPSPPQLTSITLPPTLPFLSLSSRPTYTNSLPIIAEGKEGKEEEKREQKEEEAKGKEVYEDFEEDDCFLPPPMPVMTRQLTGIGDDHDTLWRTRRNPRCRSTWLSTFFASTFRYNCKDANEYHPANHQILRVRRSIRSLQRIYRRRYWIAQQSGIYGSDVEVVLGTDIVKYIILGYMRCW